MWINLSTSDIKLLNFYLIIWSTMLLEMKGNSSLGE